MHLDELGYGVWGGRVEVCVIGTRQKHLWNAILTFCLSDLLYAHTVFSTFRSFLISVFIIKSFWNIIRVWILMWIGGEKCVTVTTQQKKSVREKSCSNQQNLLAQFMPISDLSSWWIANFFPVIQCCSSAIWSKFKTSNHFILGDTIPVEQHQLKWHAIEILSCAFGGWNVECKTLVENGTKRSFLHVRLLLGDSLSLKQEREEEKREIFCVRHSKRHSRCFS